MESLTTPEKLREQAHLSLMQRCVLIERQMSVSISSSTLRNVYQQMGVGFLKLHRGWHTSRNDLELRRLRVLFCRKMEAPRAETTAGSLPAGYTGRYATLSTKMPTRAMLMAATPMAVIIPVHGPN